MAFIPGQRMLSTSMPCSKLFISFLNDVEGCELLTAFEQSGRLLFHVQDDSLVIEHEPLMSAQQIMALLQRKWHEISMRKAVHLTLLHQQCTHSQTVVLPVAQAALIWSQRCLIIRDTKIVDILVDLKGTVSWFGQIECVNHAAQLISRLIHEHFPKNTEAPEGYTDFHSSLSALNMNNMLNDGFCFPSLNGLGSGLSSMASLQNSQLYNHLGNEDLLRSLAASALQQQQAPASCAAAAAGDAGFGHMLSPVPSEVGGINAAVTQIANSMRNLNTGTPRKRERIYFMVPSTDAPRLIGTRGVNKKRIEEQTGCAITLHTESKKDGEFPVEVNGTSLAVCERAKMHIEKFLMSNGNPDEKKDRSRPKVHLEFSPRKQGPPLDSSTPKKEYQKDERYPNEEW